MNFKQLKDKLSTIQTCEMKEENSYIVGQLLTTNEVDLVSGGAAPQQGGSCPKSGSPDYPGGTYLQTGGTYTQSGGTYNQSGGTYTMKC